MNTNHDGVRSVAMSLTILETVAFSESDLGVTEVAARVGLSKPSAHRHLQTLVGRGYLSQDPVSGRYRVGPQSRLLSSRSPEIELLQVADGPLRKLRNDLRQSVVLSAPVAAGALVLTTIQGTSAIEIGVRPGGQLPFHASAQGKALLAYAPASAQQRALKAPLRAFTNKTPTDPKDIRRELAKIREQGYACSFEEVLLGFGSIAAPVFNPAGACAAAVAVVGSIQYISANSAPDMSEHVKQAADRISRSLGHSRAHST